MSLEMYALNAEHGVGEHEAAEQRAELSLRTALEQSQAWPTAPVWVALFDAELGGDEHRGTGIEAWQQAVAAATLSTAPAHLRAYTRYRLAQGGTAFS